IEEIRNAPKNILNAQKKWCSIVESVSTSDNKNPLLHSHEVPSDQNSDDNQKFSHNSSSFSSDSIQMQADKKKSNSKNALKVFKKTQNEMKKGVAKGRILKQKLKI
ncbi:13035_t:CDS:2, partial [Funneliformis geosporum]